MDPASAVGLVGSIIGIANSVLQTANRLSLLQTKYRQANILVSLLIGQMFTIQTTLKQLTNLQQHNALNLYLLGPDGVDGLTISLDGCGTLFASLNEHLDVLERRAEGELSIRGKLSLLWRENEIKEYLAILDRHVNALNLLLNIIQCKSSNEQRRLLEDEDSITILRLARESTESLYSLNATSLDLEQRSIFTQDISNLSTQFDFDRVLLGSRAYHAAFKTNVRDLIHYRVKSRYPYVTMKDKVTSKLPAASDKRETTSNTPVEYLSETRDSRIQSLNSDQTMHFTVTSTPGASKAQRLWPLRNYALSPLSFARRRSETIRKFGKIEAVPSASGLSSQPVPTQVKTLLLGASGGGKSTLLKAFKLLLDRDYSRQERESFKKIIYNDIVMGMITLLHIMNELEIPLHWKENESHVDTIDCALPLEEDFGSLPSAVSNALKALWADEGVRRAYSRPDYGPIPSSLGYYLDEISRIGSPDYEPDTKDVIMARKLTLEVTETIFFDNPYGPGIAWDVFDVGGVRSERKKWIHVFENVDLIFFTVDICCYDRALVEDINSNSMLEALMLWDSLVNGRWFFKTSFVLVFTHTDQLASYLAESAGLTCFPDLPKDISVRAFKLFLKNKFLELVKWEGTQRPVEVMFESLAEDHVGAASRILRRGREAVLAQRA